jgi:A/G-specific adenine glycosylase
LHRFHHALQQWYGEHGRHHLPWRTTRDPYPIWLSEVMLQQTQVATVLARFYHPFLEKFPTVRALADAPREAVMKAWEGLGYYRRAGFLHDAAKEIVRDGWWVVRGENASPSTPHHALLTRLQSLPGIGKNTAHAIAAFAYGQPVAILEANVKRIVARVFAWENPTEPQLWAGAEALLNRAEPFDYNQAMMDLGSMVCTPAQPACATCPAAAICRGKTAPERYPARKAKKATPTRQQVILVLEDAAGRLHLEARSAALLGGLYGFPQVPATTDLRYAMREMHIAPHDWQALGDVVHVYSHFRLEGRVQHGRLRRRMNSPGWFTREEISALPLSGVDHKVLALVDARHTAPKNAGKRAVSRPRG